MKALLILAAMFVAACGDSRDGDTAGKEIADDYNMALDKAGAVEGQLESAKERVDEALDDADDAGNDTRQ